VKAGIRSEGIRDAAAVQRVHLAAFPTSLEAELVARLHDDRDSVISLVAEDRGKVVGHVMLSRMAVEADGSPLRALGLGPVAVLPAMQRQGLGTVLIEAALSRAAGLGEEIVFVLGEPAYYTRFGFSVETAAPFASPYAGPCLMAKSLKPVPSPNAGRAHYATAFSTVQNA
jgi:putative acetyltransferase